MLSGACRASTRPPDQFRGLNSVGFKLQSLVHPAGPAGCGIGEFLEKLKMESWGVLVVLTSVWSVVGWKSWNEKCGFLKYCSRFSTIDRVD